MYEDTCSESCHMVKIECFTHNALQVATTFIYMYTDDELRGEMVAVYNVGGAKGWGRRNRYVYLFILTQPYREASLSLQISTAVLRINYF